MTERQGDMTMQDEADRKLRGMIQRQPAQLRGENLDWRPNDLYDEGPSLADLLVRWAFSSGGMQLTLNSGVQLYAVLGRIQLGEDAHAEMTAAGLRALLLRAFRAGQL